MDHNGYYRPITCHEGSQYYLREIMSEGIFKYKKVDFVAYRPHPAEVAIYDGIKRRAVHRSLIYARSTRDDEAA